MIFHSRFQLRQAAMVAQLRLSVIALQPKLELLKASLLQLKVLATSLSQLSLVRHMSQLPLLCQHLVQLML
jgi:hypothetical protein